MKKNTRRVQLTCVLTVHNEVGNPFLASGTKPYTQKMIREDIRDSFDYGRVSLNRVASIQLTELDEAPYTKKKGKK